MKEEATGAAAQVATASHLRGFLSLCALVALVWAACTLLVYALLPDWSTRGTFGDSFGAVNALFSGLAFAGVIHALNLQREELRAQRAESLETRRVFEAQLQEMRTARELVAQPLPIPSEAIFRVERPRLFYSPPEDEHSAQSRYTVKVPLSNPTQYPAIGVNVSVYVHFGDPRTVLSSTDTYLSILTPGASSETDLSTPDFLFTGDGKGALFDQLRQHDPRKVPALSVVAIFRNTLGAHFRLVQSYQVYAPDDLTQTIRDWHTGIAGFGAKYKQELTQLRELRRKHAEQSWDSLFQSVKKEFAESVPGPDFVELRAYAVPASFLLENITKDEYEKGLKNAAYSQVISNTYDCPVEMDSRK